MRFRLFSYVAAMLLLAGVVGANLTSVATPTVFYPAGASVLERGGPKVDVQTDVYGWPLPCVANTRWDETPLSGLVDDRVYWDWPALALDIVIGLAIPVAGLLACEFVFRRYAPRNRIE